jgi:hypothetical protein
VGITITLAMTASKRAPVRRARAIFWRAGFSIAVVMSAKRKEPRTKRRTNQVHKARETERMK